MKRPMMSISKDFAVSPRDISRAAITAKLLLASRVPLLQGGRRYGGGKKSLISDNFGTELLNFFFNDSRTQQDYPEDKSKTKGRNRRSTGHC